MIDFQPNNHTLDAVYDSNNRNNGLKVEGFDDLANYSLAFNVKDGNEYIGFVSQYFDQKSKTFERTIKYQDASQNKTKIVTFSNATIGHIPTKLKSLETINKSYDVIGIVVFNSTKSTSLKYLIDPNFVFVRINSAIKYCELNSVNTHFVYIFLILNTFLCSALTVISRLS